jgi:sterol desaturase/sphingolipid hydroxylase (fatty acid hydroxylase superfamily)
MQSLLDWARARSFADAAWLSLAVNVVVFLLAIGIGEVVARAFGKRRVADLPPPLSRGEVVLAALCVLLNALVMLAGWWLFRADILRVLGTSSAGAWLVDALILVVVMDAAMYAMHRLAHWRPIFRYVHGVHHRHERPRPLTLFVLHPIEVLGFGGLWLCVLCAHSFALGGMLLYLTINTLFGTLGHVGVEPLPAAWARWPLLGLIGTSTFHARHHQRPTASFGFYTTIWDRLFGTLDRDYESAFARPLPAVSGSDARD